MKKYLPWSVVAILLVWVVALYYTKPRSVSVKSEIDTVFVRINEIKKENDSILIAVDSSRTVIKYIDKWYEKEFVTITNQSVASDVEFFTNYLEAQAGR